MAFKRLAFFLLIFFLFVDCTRDFNNPYDSIVDPNSWKPVSFSGDLNQSNGIVNFSWTNSNEKVTSFILEWKVNGHFFETELPSTASSFSLDWNDFDSIWLSSKVGDRPSSNLVFSNDLDAISKDFFEFSIDPNSKYEPGYLVFFYEILALGGKRYEPSNVPNEYIKDLSIYLNGEGVEAAEIPNEFFLFSNNPVVFTEVYPDIKYYFSIFDNSQSERVLLKTTEKFEFQSIHYAFPIGSIPPISKNQPFTIRWTNTYSFIDSVEIFIVDQSGKKSLLASNVPNINEYTTIFPNNVPEGLYKFLITNKSGIFSDESPSFYIN